ncbi:MAG: hypothetical protein JNL50_03690 [Phycisphaerae bacterium]|nr:hypothetical protein [Phycisphaerae bacterium]
MSGRSLTQREASKRRRIAQIAALGGGALAVGAMFSRLPGIGDAPGAPGAIVWPEVKGPVESGGERARVAHDLSAAATRLSLVSNKPKAAAPPPEPGEVPNADVGGAVEVKYLGAVLEATRKVALLRVGERQRMVAEGTTISLSDGGTLEVVSVDGEGVVIRDGQGERRVEKSARTASAVTTITGAGGVGLGATPVAGPDGDESGVAGAEDMQRKRAEAEARLRALKERTRAGGVKQ